MGMVINVSEPAMDLLLYGDKSNLISNYLMQQMQNIQPAFNEFSNRIYQSIQNSYNFVNDKLTQYGLYNQIKQSGVNVLDNYYEELLSFQQLQNANFTMQRWVMAHPEIKQLYVNQDIDGYSETYKNVFDKGVGENDYNYRRVMDGVIVSNDDDHWVVKHHLEDLLYGDKELDHTEKVKILTTYDAMDWLLGTCKFDFTSKSETPAKINRS